MVGFRAPSGLWNQVTFRSHRVRGKDRGKVPGISSACSRASRRGVPEHDQGLGLGPGLGSELGAELGKRLSLHTLKTRFRVRVATVPVPLTVPQTQH